jgi:F-type H+-transporting ATPase subunit b
LIQVDVIDRRVYAVSYDGESKNILKSFQKICNGAFQMVNVDLSVMIQIVNFLFLIFALNAVLFKPIRKILIERKEKITGLEEGVESLNDDAREKDEAFASGIKAARAKGLKEKETLLQAAAEEEKQIVGKITQKAQAELAEIRAKIAADTKDVKKTLLDQVDDYATTIGQKILGRTI